MVFALRGAPCGYDADGTCLVRGDDDKQQSAPDAHPDDSQAIFVDGMFRVGKEER
jgi:hypothetical protein